MKLPRHLAIIMDGNGRWAQLKKRPRVHGHLKGTRIAKKIITECADLKIPHLTLYAFSTENWLRPASEVDFLMKLLSRYLKRETENLIKKNIRFNIIGDLNRLPPEVTAAVAESIKRTANCTGLQLTFALSYGSRQEITSAAKAMALRVLSGEISPDEIDEEMLSSHLYTSPTPDPDFIIRTSGEHRISNFLLWQAAYSELYFTDRLWPDFDISDLHIALKDFEGRTRRFGQVKILDENLHN